MKKLGSIFTTAGGLFGVLCPACIPALGAFLATIGLGFLANFIVSRAITLALLGLALIALHVSALVHRRSSAFVLAVVAAMGMIAGRNFVLNQWLIYASGAALVGAAILDYSYRRRAPAMTCLPPEALRAQRSLGEVGVKDGAPVGATVRGR